ncbi:transposase [Paenibacillus sp. MMS18-CY102]|uniref:transposase n=1 Tax=Paenibacillus sp. MMS18-CY102 TaxID=2682849 RepID=UPI001365DEEE|nr:transposase [Paenibacillus sp. MMS18-CY102]MWC31151.1 transposase [Paenibacillus sp. MMS18-CY102]
MRQTLQEQHNATVYQYRLIRKLNIPPKLLKAYKLAPYFLVAALIVLFKFSGLLYALIGLPVVIVIRYIINRLTLIRVDEWQRRRFGWSYSPPFIGYMPTSEIQLGIYRKTERHACWIGLCIYIALIPWINTSGSIGLIVWHLWTCCPSQITLLLLRKQNSDGVLKLDSSELCYYHR